MRKKLLPGNAKNSKVVELPALIALKGLNKIWFTEAHYNDILSIVLVWEIICQATHADTIYHNSPFHNKVQIKVKDIEALTPDSVARLGKKIHKELHKLRTLNERNLKPSKE